ncbi:MAG: DUF1349 domain-containing protein [Sedimentisphaerales bacterium]|nr:DUF1349 domain-containing protein [Sedimentisphaerales bacterium]
MQYRNKKFRIYPACLAFGLPRRALTIIELIIALAIITIIFAAVLPQFRVIKNSWDSRQANTEVVQNGRVLIDHINRNLSKAVSITAVSESTENEGFIVFKDNDGNDWRYDINITSRYVEFGRPGNLFDLAGPVDSLMFTCYDACDLDIPLDIATADINEIRFVTVQTILPNTAPLGRDITFTASAYLRTNDEVSDCWQNQDIGDVGADGSANESAGTWTIEGSGTDIWDNTDEFHYVYQSLSGDGQIIAQVVSVENTNAWAKAGVMIRETLDGDSKHAMMVVTPGNGTAFQRRTTTGGSSDHTAGSAVTAPYWVRLVRSGNTFTGYESADGAVWTLVDSVSITMATDVYIGLCVTSHSDGDICTAVIDNVGFSMIEYQGFTEAKADSDTTSITIPTPGSVSAVNILGSWESGTTHAAETGSNRLLVFTAHAERNGDISLNSVTYGGQPMTKVIERVVGSAGYYACVAAFVLDEAGIAAATSGTFTPVWSASPDTGQDAYGSVFLQNVDQSDSIGASAGNTATAGDTITTVALSTNEGDMVILAAACGNAGSYTVNNSFTEAVEFNMSSATGVDGYKAATGAAETPSVTHSGANRQVIIGFVAKVNEVVTGIEDDLLIAAVAVDGGTTFAEPSGWTEINQGSFGGAVTLGAWYRIAEESEPTSHTFNWSGGQQAYGWIMQFTGHNSAQPIDANSTNGQSSSTPTSPDVDTTVDNCLILRLGAFDNDDITVDNPGLTNHEPITMDTSGGSSTITLFQDGLENFDNWTTATWNLTTTPSPHSGSYSAHAARYDTDLTSDDIDTSAYSEFAFEFWYQLDDTEAGDIYLYLYDGSNYDYYDDFSSAAEDTWNHYGPITITDPQYLKANFRIRFEASINNNQENVWIDDVTVTATDSDNMVSGGAGYAIQVYSGNSGTSNFSLTSSNASRMLTIALAPDDTQNDCGGEIRP